MLLRSPAVRRRPIAAATLAALVTAGVATTAVAAPEVWPYDLSTDGSPVSYVSPTAVDPASARFAWQNTIGLVEVEVQFSIFTFTLDVTDEVPAEFLNTGGFVQGPAPFTLFNEMVEFPPPPEPASVTATVTAGLDAAGFGTVDVTDVTLGDVEVDLGPPFGVQTVTVTGIRTAGTLTIEGLIAGDVDGDGDVDFDDLLAILASFGPCFGCPGDLDGDGSVGFSDLLLVLANFGS